MFDVFGERASDVYAARVIATARAGLVVEALADSIPGTVWWFSSRDGHSWQFVDDFAPLGRYEGGGNGSGLLPNGSLVGNGERMVAYDSVNGTGAWTSFDGSQWTALAISGEQPAWAHLPRRDVALLPRGVTWTSLSGDWYAEAH